MSIESLPYPTREISDNTSLFLSDIGAEAAPIPVTGTSTIAAKKGLTYITYGSGTITFTDPNISNSVSGDYYKVIVGGSTAVVIGGVTYNKVSPVEIIRLVSDGVWITHSGFDASQITSGTIDINRLESQFTNPASFPPVGQPNINYVALNTNEIFRWNGTSYKKFSNINDLTEITVGNSNVVSAPFASAVGDANTATGRNSSAFGNGVVTTIENTQEFGIHEQGGGRFSSVRIHGPNIGGGYVALTLQNKTTPLLDGGDESGEEDDGTLMRNAYCIRRNGSDLYIDRNDNSGNVSTGLIGDVTLGASQVLTNKTLISPLVTDFSESIVNIGNSGTSHTFNLLLGTFHVVTMTDNCTFSFPTPSSTINKRFHVKILTGTGGFSATFDGVKWPGGIPGIPITSTADRYDIFSFTWDGIGWSGAAIRDYLVNSAPEPGGVPIGGPT